MEPQKPFACSLPDCGMSFTNEDHLHVHTKKHDMILQLGMEQKAAFVADQTPTPTRFIRNCEEVGLFQDLQSVNPFDEGFKRAMMDTKQGMLTVESEPTSEDVLHTPHLVFPLEPGDCAQYMANNKQNITISRSSSDETGAVKEYETTTISKLTNKVTTISRVVGKPDILDRVTDDVSIVRHKNNVIKIHSNVEIRKDEIIDTTKDIKNTKYIKKDIPPIMSQQSIDFVVDSLTGDANPDKSSKNLKRRIESDESKPVDVEDELEVIIKLPSGKNIRMKAIDESEKDVKIETKEKLKNVIANKKNKATTANIGVQLPITTGTLIPVTIVNPKIIKRLPTIPIASFEVKTKNESIETTRREVNANIVLNACPKIPIAPLKVDKNPKEISKNNRNDLDSRCAASKRYRERFKEKIHQQQEENRLLKEKNHRLAAEKAALQLILTKHMKTCQMAEDLRNFERKILNAEEYLNEI